MPDVIVNVVLFCAKCRTLLHGVSTSTIGRHIEIRTFLVEPCKMCMDDADSEGYDRSRAKAGGRVCEGTEA